MLMDLHGYPDDDDDDDDDDVDGDDVLVVDDGDGVVLMIKRLKEGKTSFPF